MNLDESFAGKNVDYQDIWDDIRIALDEVELNTLDRVVAKETFDGLVALKRRVRFRVVASPAKPTPGFTSVFTYVFPCHHLSCACSCPQ
jgi:hypothetical protein